MALLRFASRGVSPLGADLFGSSRVLNLARLSTTLPVRSFASHDDRFHDERSDGVLRTPPPSLFEWLYRRFPIQLVREREQWVVERFGKFSRTLQPGFNLITPLMEWVEYKQNMKVKMCEMKSQLGITKDNVELQIDGVLYWQIGDAFKASYNIQDPAWAVSQLAIGIMRAELGKLEMERVFEERAELNTKIMSAINESCNEWGTTVLRYEVCDIKLPRAVKEAMQLQTIAERRKRETVIESTAEREQIENVAAGEKRRVVLESEADMQRMQNLARGEAHATLVKARAAAAALEEIGEALRSPSGRAAAQLRVASQYVEAFEKIAKKGNTMLLPGNASDASSMVAQAMAIFKGVPAGSAGDGGVAQEEAEEQAQHGKEKAKTREDSLDVKSKIEQDVREAMKVLADIDESASSIGGRAGHA
eukprot:TRINITY_DN11687_c0_g2_i1.p1 TRINITY_DN11687_c0_g2~~TRINITY_DN11687_c0_g2_i1.p1  ORF type:complete len:433 (-),score=125.80 TRINITY_DN11687_c0_g2_i1:12-1274(-)